MSGFLLHTGVMIACVMQVVAVQCAETTPSGERPNRAIDDFGFSAVPIENGSYRTQSSVSGNGNAEIADAHSTTNDVQSGDGLATGSLSTTRILKGRYEFSDLSWQLTPHIGPDFGTAEVREKPLGYSFQDWAAYRGDGATLGFSQKALEIPDNASPMGWTSHLGLGTEIQTKLGIPSEIPSTITRRGIRFGADFHF